MTCGTVGKTASALITCTGGVSGVGAAMHIIVEPSDPNWNTVGGLQVLESHVIGAGTVGVRLFTSVAAVTDNTARTMAFVAF